MGNVSKDKRDRTPLSFKGWCPKHDHFAMGAQEAREIFGLDCLICLETAAEKFDQPRAKGCPQDHLDRIRTPCGEHNQILAL
jgi:hypothetical protein